MSKAKIVIDLSFGDGGKGLVVDNLCAKTIAKSGIKPLVVRFSAGQQCGHTVMDGKIKHTFSSFGSGSLQDCPSFFTEDTTLYLPNLYNEYEVLQVKGITPTLKVHPLAKLTLPFDVAYNRAKEELVTKHGSCGLGVGATMKRCIETPYKTFVQDLKYPELLYQKTWTVYTYYLSLIGENKEFLDCFKEYCKIEVSAFSDRLEDFKLNPIFEISPNVYIGENQDVIFEGSQGVMLDMDHGVFPNVTYANTTSKNAMKYISKWNLIPEIKYVTRCYTTRHGAGWMPDQDYVHSLINTNEEINVHNYWQGHIRIREFDYILINNSIEIDSLYHNDWHIEKNLIITCIDQRPDFKLDTSKIRGIDNFYTNDSPIRGSIKHI